MSRPTPDEYFMAMACVTATRGTCIRRRVGCILVNEENHVLATGYNGPPARSQHCTREHVCGSAAHLSSGEGLGSCAAVHAEQNALLQCYDVGTIKCAYVTTSPCEHCVKMLLNTACERIVFLDRYPGDQAMEWWLQAGREWVNFGSFKGPATPLKSVYQIHNEFQALYGPDKTR